MLRKSKRIVLSLLVILVLTASTYAFAAANSIPDSAAGYAAKSVPGYTISNIQYDLLDTNPTKLKAIIFSINPTGGSVVPAVTVKISTTSTPDFTTSVCNLTVSGTLATCTFMVLAVATPINVADVVQLDIVATSSSNAADL